MPLPTAELCFFPWWSAAVSTSQASLLKGLNSLITLVAWSICKHLNTAVFNDLRPSTKDEARLWARAGAIGLELVIPVV